MQKDYRAESEFDQRGHGYLEPASPWWIIDRVQGKLPMHVGHEVVAAGIVDNQTRLTIANGHGNVKELKFDFVIAGTGYDVDISRLEFLDSGIVNEIKRIEKSPELSINFESSVRNLYFVGPLAFFCFGPLFRFVCGAEVTARRLSRRLSH